MSPDRILFDRQATALNLTPTRENYTGPVLPPDTRIETQEIVDQMLERQARKLNPVPETGEPAPDPELWRKLANCSGVIPELFFPSTGESSEEAKAACRECLVQQDCLEYALATNQDHGIWGGVSERERRRIKRQRKLNESVQ